MYPNWKSIREIKCATLRLALYTAEGDELVRLRSAFPHCYSPDRNDLRVPLSLVKKAHDDALRKISPQTWERHRESRWWTLGLGAYSIPVAFCWPSAPQAGDPFTGPPPEVLSLLIGRSLGDKMVVKYLNEDFIVARLSLMPLQTHVTTDPRCVYQLVLVHSRFIDLTA